MQIQLPDLPRSSGWVLGDERVVLTVQSQIDTMIFLHSSCRSWQSWCSLSRARARARVPSNPSPPQEIFIFKKSTEAEINQSFQVCVKSEAVQSSKTLSPSSSLQLHRLLSLTLECRILSLRPRASQSVLQQRCAS